MVALYKISTNTVIQDWGNSIPSVFYIEGECDVHCPTPDWAWGDYKLIPRVYHGTRENEYQNEIITSIGVVNGEFVTTFSYTDPPLESFAADLCSRVDKKAEEVREIFITPGSGQMGIYLMKYDEALRIAANSEATATDYPLNGASVGLPGITSVREAANLTIIQARQWMAVGGAIEQIRLGGKAAINAANSVTNAVIAYNAIDWTPVVIT
jgi:hypothetical protein